MATTTLLDLDERLLRSLGDWLQVPVTTAIAGSKLIVSTGLQNYDHSSDGFFDNWWVYIEDYVNAGAGACTNGTGVCTGSPISLDAGATTVAVTTVGTFTISLVSNASGTAATGTCAVTGTPVTLVAGANTVTTSGAIGTIIITLTGGGTCRLLGSTTYAYGTGTAYVYGANLITDVANKATVRLSKLAHWDTRVDAINRAIEDIYPALHKRIDDRTLITGNCLPDGHFESWSSTTALNWYTALSGAFARESSIIRGGTYSAKYTAGAASDYFDIDSNDYPKLLDLRGQGVTFRCRAYPEVDDDATLEIFTIQAGVKEGEYTADAGTSATQIVDSELESSVDDYYNGDYVWNSTRSLGAVVTDYDGATQTITVAIASQASGDIYHINTAQTLTSTTACPAGKWTLLNLEDQDINDDITYISIRFGVTTNAKYVYFDDARLIGRNVFDYLLPDEIEVGHLSRVEEQIDSGYAGDPGAACDNIGLGVTYSPVFGWTIIDDGTDKYLHTPYKLSSERRLKLIGYTPFDVLDSTDSTETIPTSDGGQLNTLIALADYYLYENVSAPVGADDIIRYEREMAKKWAKYQSLLRRHRMPKPAETMNVAPLG